MARRLPCVIEDVGWELRWPPDLLQREGRRLLSDAARRLPDWADRVSHLLEEAFVGTEAGDAFDRAEDHVDPFAYDPLLPSAPDTRRPRS